MILANDVMPNIIFLMKYNYGIVLFKRLMLTHQRVIHTFLQFANRNQANERLGSD